jgi:hypothetical protein
MILRAGCSRALRYLPILGLIELLGCSTAAKENLMRSALDDRDAREEWFQATLEILDSHPEYVDHFYGTARGPAAGR